MKKILIVDDDQMFSDMLGEVLTAEGFSVLVEHDGAHGLAQALTEHPDLIMMDYFMPGVTGAQAVQQLRADAWGSSVPVVFLTNMAQTDISLTPEHNMECLLKTDWTLDGLVQKVKEILARAGQS